MQKPCVPISLNLLSFLASMSITSIRACLLPVEDEKLGEDKKDGMESTKAGLSTHFHIVGMTKISRVKAKSVSNYCHRLEATK